MCVCVRGGEMEREEAGRELFIPGVLKGLAFGDELAGFMNGNVGSIVSGLIEAAWNEDPSRGLGRGCEEPKVIVQNAMDGGRRHCA